MFKTLLFLTSLVFATNVLYAQSSAEVDVSAQINILAGLTVDCGDALIEFGEIAAGDTATTSINTALGAAGGPSYSTVDPAGFMCTVYGEADANVSLAASDCPRQGDTGLDWLDIGSFVIDYPLDFLTIEPDGDYSFWVHGVLSLAMTGNAPLGLNEKPSACTIALAYD